MTHEPESDTGRDAERDARVVALREGGASWKEIADTFGLSRQAARYCYQRGKRIERRKARRLTAD